MQRQMSNADIMRMKGEAIKRAHYANEQNKRKHPQQENIPSQNDTMDKKVMRKQESSDNTLLDCLSYDYERVLLFVLVLILADEKADIELIFALIYLII